MEFMDIFTSPELLLALATLAALEIVLGIDNIIFISIVTGKLPENQRVSARRLGIALAAITRIMLLFSLAWIIGLTATLFEVFGNAISWRDIILIAGGAFLIVKSAMEMHDKLEGPGHGERSVAAQIGFAGAILQILMLDVVFSLDSVITAIGMVDRLEVMILAVLVAVGVMVIFANPVGNFVEKHPTIQMLALSFLLLIGTVLIADGFDFHIPKGYVYSAIAFATVVELLNIRLRKKSVPVQMHDANRLDQGE
ncbi:TerC family protein [Thermithiobacillus plumbiphilus]|uniref:TerC family protein n=1 Tax=Thermithiobacillus plumbiphilus TaxID=1729899 RepID=A0ABU9DBA9_9PROT